MTNEEAIQEFKNILCEKINDMHMKAFRDFYYEAIDYADALKKQIPESVKKVKNKDRVIYTCPHCFKKCSKHDEFCYVCNQVLDWSDCE